MVSTNHDNAEHYDVAVIGGGAAGMFCAFTAGNRGKRVLLLEHNESVGKKIAISGGGRCNFTNINAGPENYFSGNHDFCKSALARYTPLDFIALIEQHRIAYHEKKLGQLFCNDSSRQIITMLSNECAQASVRTICNCSVEDVQKNDLFRISSSKGTFTSKSLIVATGGLSFAKLGASDIGYQIARKFSINVTTLRPGLVPLTFIPEERNHFAPLAGVSIPVRVTHRGRTFEESMLFTHHGVSGPAILQISSCWNDGESLCIDLLPSKEDSDSFESALRTGATAFQTLSRLWPRRFAESWCPRNAPERPLARCTKSEIDSLLNSIHGWKASISGTGGYPKAEVTVGGVETRELSSKTMEARKVPGLYFIGEVVDVTGWLGGYNFQWAWASANAAGTSV